MKYKALLLDCDGTIIPYDYAALPSDTLALAIQKAQEKVTVCLVTGRSFAFTKEILKKLGLHAGIIVTNNGAEIYDLKTMKSLYEQPIESDDFKKIITYFDQKNISFFAKQHQEDLSYQEEYFTKVNADRKCFMIFTEEKFTVDEAGQIVSDLSQIPNLNIHKTQHADPHKFGVILSHTNATKMHGVHVILETLGLKKEEVIGVGDSYNDFPLLMASGLKVAMGNAVPELKAIADYIAPSVIDDGVADVIERFILTPTP